MRASRLVDSIDPFLTTLLVFYAEDETPLSIVKVLLLGGPRARSYFGLLRTFLNCLAKFFAQDFVVLNEMG